MPAWSNCFRTPGGHIGSGAERGGKQRFTRGIDVRAAAGPADVALYLVPLSAHWTALGLLTQSNGEHDGGPS
jgi:hypothetical protein